MLKILISAILLFIITQFQSILSTSTGEGRVINGTTAKPFKYPFMISIFFDKKFICGGTLINNEFILTAAHCFPFGTKKLKHYEFHFHRHNITELPTKEGAEIRLGKKVYIHEQYNKNNLYHDVAIVRLNKPVFNGPKVQISSETEYSEGDLFIATGWGLLEPHGRKASELLQQVILPIYNREQCIQSYQINANYQVKENQLCVGFQDGSKDTCQGDSGGPLFFNGNDETIIVGITSNGISCARPGIPAIYTNVGAYKTWIEAIVGRTS